MKNNIDTQHVEACMRFLEQYVGDSGVTVGSLVELYLFDLSKTYGVGEGLIINAIINAKFDTYNEKFLTEYIKNYKTEKTKKTKWEIYLPLNIEIKDNIKVKILGTDVILYKVGRPKKVRRQLTEQFFRKYLPLDFPVPDTQVVLFAVNVYASDEEEATEMALRYFNALRSCFEILYSGLDRTWNSNNFIKQSKTRFPYWTLHKGEDENLEGGFFVIYPHLGERVNKVDGNDIKECMKLIRGIESCSENFRDYILHLFNLWLGARDSIYENDALLSYWQCLEFMTLADESQGNTEKVIDRTCMLLKASGLKIIPTETLKFFARQRNKFVHESSYEPNYSLEHLNYIVYGCIRFLFQQRRLFRSRNDINAFYETCKLLYNKNYRTEVVFKKIKSLKVLNER